MLTCKRIPVALLSTLLVIGCVSLAGAEAPVYPNAESTKPLQTGAKVPSACVQTVSGESVDLANQVRETGALLVFYRGGW